MDRTDMEGNRSTWHGGSRGLFLGALIGAAVMALASIALAFFEVGSGGPGLHVMSGAALGGLAGFFWGSIQSSRLK